MHSRKETYKTAKFLQEEAMRNDDLAKFVPASSASREVLQVSGFPPWPGPCVLHQLYSMVCHQAGVFSGSKSG